MKFVLRSRAAGYSVYAPLRSLLSEHPLDVQQPSRARSDGASKLAHPHFAYAEINVQWSRYYGTNRSRFKGTTE